MRASSRFLHRSIPWRTRLGRDLIVCGHGELTGAGEQLDSSQQLALRRMPDAIVTHLVRATREDVLQESPNELLGGKGHRPPSPLFAFPIAEGYFAVIDTDQSAVGKGNLVDVPGQVLEDPFGPLHGGSTVNPPPLGPNGVRELLFGQCLAGHLDKHSPKDQREGLDRHQVVLASRHPASVASDSACRNQQVDMRVID